MPYETKFDKTVYLQSDLDATATGDVLIELSTLSDSTETCSVEMSPQHNQLEQRLLNMVQSEIRKVSEKIRKVSGEVVEVRNQIRNHTTSADDNRASAM